MLNHREPSNEVINKWLTNILYNFSIRRRGSNHWQVHIPSSSASYNLDIVEDDAWITFSVVMLHDVHGQRRVSFYKELLDLNARLNGVQIGIQHGKLMLTRAVPKTKLDRFFLAQSLAIIQNAHETTYPYILKRIKSLGLKPIIK